MGARVDGGPYLRKQPHYVVYRSAKYSGIKDRILIRIGFLGRRAYYSIFKPLERFSSHLIELCALSAFLVLLPIFLINISLLWLVRRLRCYLVRRFYPNAQICEDFSPRCILLNKSDGMVNSIGWTRGRVDIEELRAQFEEKVKEVPELRSRLSDKFGVRVWLPAEDFNIQNHIMEPPKQFYKDEYRSPILSPSGKPLLQKLVSGCVSKDIISQGRSPWSITIIRQPESGGGRERSCCVLRFHSILLRDLRVQSALGELFILKSRQGFDVTQPEKQFKTSVKSFFSKIFLFKKSLITPSEWRTWLTLRRKQWGYHSSREFLTGCLLEFYAKLRSPWDYLRHFRSSSDCQIFISFLQNSFLLLRSTSRFFIELISTLFEPKRSNGFRRNVKSEVRQISWSQEISEDAVEAILEKLGKNGETHLQIQSIFLTAISMALSEYYSETNLHNPGRVGVNLPLTQNGSRASSRALLNTNSKSSPLIELKNIENQLASYPKYKILGSYFLQKWLPLILPRSLAFYAQSKMYKAFPLTFSYVNQPFLSLWGQLVDEYITWPSPQSDFSVSITLTKQNGFFRVSVSSPMKSLDLALTKYLHQHLLRIVEAVGGNKSQLIHKKSSPNLSNCSTPLCRFNSDSNLLITTRKHPLR